MGSFAAHSGSPATDELAVSSPGSSPSDTGSFGRSSPSAGSYELHVLDTHSRRASTSNIAPTRTRRRSKASGISPRRSPSRTPRASPEFYDGQDQHESENCADSASDTDPEMSTAPLLARSSQGHDTRSYGGAPGLSGHSSTGADDDIDHVTATSKTKGKLRKSPSPATSAGQSSPTLTASRTRRRSTRSTRSNNIIDDAVEEEPLEARFTSTSVLSIPAGAPDIFKGLQSRGESEEESSESEDDEAKSNSQPADNSPYAQVRASVAATDDTSLSINTPRMWVLSILFAILGSSTNLFFSLRYPSVSITPIIALLLVHPLGLLWDQTLKRADDPDEKFVNGSICRDGDLSDAHGPEMAHGKRSWKSGLRLWLAQGRWNGKEHCCVYISSNVSFGFAFATDVIVEQTKFYHQDLGVVYQILLTVSTQVLGYALAGLTRQYLVRPSGMIWPATLVSTAMFTALHKDQNRPANGWTISRSRFFAYVFAGSMAFYFLPGLLMPALSSFSVITWFAPKNVVIANLFGTSSGLGLFPMTFDWGMIAYIGSPLVVPFWAALNIMGGLVVVMWIMAPLMYYANVMYTSYMPILSAAVFDNTGKPYDVSRILTNDFLFDEKAYKNYSRVFLPVTYMLSYALQFAALTALISHTALWHGKDIWRQWRRSYAEIKRHGEAEYEPLPANGNGGSVPEAPRANRANTSAEPDLEHLLTAEDVHNRLMRRYDDVPFSWYIMTGVSMAAIGIFVVEYYPIHLPWYGLLLALSIGGILYIPIGIVMAITNQQSSLYLICQLICGVVFPGRPVANMVFTTYGYITTTQGLKFSSDLKLGHYMKIPPRTLFNLQLSATIISSMTQIGVLNWMLNYIPGVCTPQAVDGFTCPIARVHFNGSILWGVVGPSRFFGPGALYRPLIWAFLFGALAPIGLWLIARNNRNSMLRKVNLAVVFGSLSWIPPATGLNFSVWGIVCYLFNYRLRRSKTAWWEKYNMTLSAALDSGVAVGLVVIFFGLVFPGFMDGFKWWGTEVYKRGCDWRACPYKNVPKGGHFGPGEW